jgi:hypothetical protein
MHRAVTTLPNPPPALALLALLALGSAVPARAAQAPEPAPPAARGDSEVGGPAARDGVKRVAYVPEIVKAQLREEVKERVLQQAIEERWATPNAIPAWTQRFALNADVRLRWEMVFFKRGNDTTYNFDFNAVNSGVPLDVTFNDQASFRYLNADQNRRRPRMRARLGVDGDVGEGFSGLLRLASGDGSTPVSTNQTLGGSAGDFSKYQFWLDRATLRYEPIRNRPTGFVLEGGRFENPFFSTNLLWSENLNFDGFAFQGRTPAGQLQVFLNAGAFPFFITGLDFPAEKSQKFHSFDKWLVAGQLGAEWKRPELFSLKLAAAFYYFDHIEGRSSSQCDTHLKGFSCDTDASRPSFAQKGNTYKVVRTPSDEALIAELAGASEYQYFGLASLFRELAITGRFELRAAPSWKLTLDGEFVRNLGFSKNRIADQAVNNLGTCDADENCPYAGGRIGYQGRISVGSPAMNKRWSWSIAVTYRYLESDAVVDAFTDSDFGMGGTNLKGFIVGGALALADNVSASVRWMSADSIVSLPYSVDVFHFDVSARY